MSLRLEMLQVARLAPRVLGPSTDLVRAYLRSQLQADGAFPDRSGSSDLYYTTFGLESLVALQAEVPAAAVRSFLKQYGAGDSLDLVHLACLARCWAALPRPRLDPATAAALLSHIERFRTGDGGYHAAAGARHGTAYHAFLALGAYQDLGAEIPLAADLARSVLALQRADGGFANEPAAIAAATPATAAAVMVLRHLSAPAPAETRAWLLARCHETGGFFASPTAPVPDLLSTATALHALAALNAPTESIAERCLDFVDTLWTSRGAFYGTWADDEPDCEYTFYGLLALGHLSLAS